MSAAAIVARYPEHVPEYIIASTKRLPVGTKIMITLGEARKCEFVAMAKIPAIIWSPVRRSDYITWANMQGLKPAPGMFCYRIATD